MTITSTVRKAGPFNGDDVTVIFAFVYKIFADADVLVILTDSAGVETVQTLTTDYSVTLNSDQNVAPGGTITMVVAPATGELLTLGSDMPETQPATIRNQGPYLPDVLENMVDRNTISVQQHGEELNRALLLKRSSAHSNLEFPEPVALNLVRWNAGATALENVTVDSLGIGVDFATLTGVETLTNKTLPSPVIDGSMSGDAFLDDDTMAANSPVKFCSQQSIVAYISAQIITENLAISADSGSIVIDLDSETLIIAGGTGLTSSAGVNTVTLAIDASVVTLTGSQNLTNKALSNPTISGTGFSNANHAHAAANSGGTINAANLSGTTLNSSVVSSSLTSLGTLTNLSITTLLSGAAGIDLDGIPRFQNAYDTTTASGANVFVNTDGRLVRSTATYVTLSGSETLSNKTFSDAIVADGGITLSADTLVPDGSATAPSIHRTAQETGFYFGSNNISITLSGANSASFNASGLNLVAGDQYYINGISVLNATTLGVAVVSSSLTSLGTLTNLSVTTLISGAAGIDLDGIPRFQSAYDTTSSSNANVFVNSDGRLVRSTAVLATLAGSETLSNKTFSDTIIADGGIRTDGVNALKTKVINIGDWNMDSTTSISVAHGLTFANIISVFVMIRTDAGTALVPLNTGVSAANTTPQGFWTVGAPGSDIDLFRLTGGNFDNAGFDSTSYNRGYIIIEYLA